MERWVVRFTRNDVPRGPALVCLLVCNLLDAVLTLFLLEHGADEFNPLMALAHGVSPLLFVILKFGMVYGSLALLVALPVGIMPKRRIVRFGAAIYLAVVLYECVLVLQLRQLLQP